MHHLIEINELLTKLYEIALLEREHLHFDSSNHLMFTKIQTQLCELIDGFSGTYLPLANIDSRSLFLNMVPLSVQKVATQLRLQIVPINLYTGYQRDGFLELPLRDPFSFKEDLLPLSLFGTVCSGTQFEITLDHHASTLDDAYTNYQLTITSGQGAHQKSLISFYDGITKAARLNPFLDSPVNHTSTYLIESEYKNEHIFSLDGTSSCPLATHIFGADNYRTDLLNYSLKIFKPITQEESNYRQMHHISETDTTIYTQSEHIQRRKLYLFDCEFGNLHTQENIFRMVQQISLSLDQIKVLILNQKILIGQMQQALPQHILNNEYQLL